ncbi:MAG: bifunctional folylpolyglutamate synthase/dihydrofolate synthase [Candidatus Eremiobacteraeota bacterium]|nr:bifunctional folylpolyglutamate synthase/dihydrofolate synthase [Candidatus Eremiobacteraeota bacterium]
MNFAAAEHYLIGTINETFSRREPYRLERMRAFLRELGNPQDTYPTLHVGGTSGKGSTSTMASAALHASGLRTGLHTKPHLSSMTERARIDGVAVSEERFAGVLESMMPAIERTAADHGRPTYYETLLALTFVYFYQERVDIAAIEVGLGGRLDGTNVLAPLVTAITSIGFDHMDVLGETIESIATEKAGIIKPGVPIVSSVENETAQAILASEALRVGAPMVRVRDAARIERLDDIGAAQRYAQSFAVTTERAKYSIGMPVLGAFQRRNAATAIVALEALPAQLRPSPAAVERGFSFVSIPGRMEVFPGHPTVVFDIAHNAEKAEHLVVALAEHFEERRRSFVVAIGESKDASQIVRALTAVPASFIFTTFEASGRTATRPQRLARIAESFGAWGRSIEDPVEALSIARSGAGSDDVIVVTGSTFVVAKLRAWWLENVAHARPNFA